MSTSINDENLWENYETIWTNIEKNIESNTSLVYDLDIYRKI